MPSTYTTSGVELIDSGEQSGAWGTTTNTNLQILDRLISQAGAISLSGTTHTLTLSDGVLSDGQYAVLVFGGSPSGTNTVTISPNDAKRVFIVKNGSGQTVTLTQGSGGNVSVLDGRTAIVYCDGGGASAAVVNVSDAFVTATVAAIGALTPTDGNFVVGNGTTWVAESGNTVLTSIGVTATFGELNTLDGITASTAELNLLDGVTATTAELNILDGVTSTTAELNILDGVTADATELNLLDGKTLSGSDTEIITGTAGSDGDIVQWNADGDLVSYGAATQLQATWEAGTGTTESLVSPAKVTALVAARVYEDGEDATTSGSTHDFTGIPAGVNEIDVFLDSVSTTGNTDLFIQIGTGGVPTTTGYYSLSTNFSTNASSTSSFAIRAAVAVYSFTVLFQLRRVPGTNKWFATHNGIIDGVATFAAGYGYATLAGTLDNIRLSTSSGTFDAGTWAIRCRK